jgi:hypothetical protein
MIDLLQALLDSFICFVRTGVTDVLNAVIVALGAIVGVVLALLPSMPTLPAIPADVTQAFAWGNYWFPVGYLVGTISTVLTLWLGWFAVQVILRWARVIR